MLILQNSPFLPPAGTTSHHASQHCQYPAGHSPLSDVALWKRAIKSELLTKKVLVFIENEKLPRKFYRCNCVSCINLSCWVKIGMTISRVSCPLVQLVMSNAAKCMSVNPTYHTTLQKPSWHSSLREKSWKHSPESLSDQSSVPCNALAHSCISGRSSSGTRPFSKHAEKAFLCWTSGGVLVSLSE